MPYRGKKPAGWSEPRPKRPDNTAAAVNYYARYLLLKAESVFDWTLPENWDKSYFLDVLYRQGYIILSKIDPYGIIPQFGTVNAYNIYYKPSEGIITNPYLPASPYNVKFGVDSVLFTLSPDCFGIQGTPGSGGNHFGIMDCVNEYATLLGNASAAVNSNLFNSKLSYVFYAKNRAQAETFKGMFDEVSTGTPAVFVDKNVNSTDAMGKQVTPWQPFNAALKQNYISSDILEDMRRIEHMFCQKIGIPSGNTEKKERLSVAETNKTDVESMACADLWEDWMNTELQEVQRVFPGLNFSFKRHYLPEILDTDGGDTDDIV